MAAQVEGRPPPRHRVPVERAGHVAGETAPRGQLHGPRVEDVAIELGHGAAARVKASRPRARRRAPGRRRAAGRSAPGPGPRASRSRSEMRSRPPGPGHVRRRRCGPRAATAPARPPHAESGRAPPPATPWTVRPAGLRLPAREVGAVVGEGDAVVRQGTRPVRRGEPGFSGRLPCAHSGQAAASVGTSSSSRLARGTPRSTWPPLRSTRLPTASTRPPRARTHSSTSRVEPPVVITSSTTTTGSPGVEPKPAAQGHDAVLALREEPAAAEAARHLVGHEHAAQGGCDDGRRPASRRAGARAFGPGRAPRTAWPAPGP